ncbi:MAG: hypothetical protein IT308_11160 [Anaerolineaceae bacterium]|nr:hypothetical protein [Anaerolineaceae bacterium]
MQQDFLWTLIGFLLTLLVFSYLLGDHFLFRLVASLFVGVAAGYAAVLLIYQVILPRLIYPFGEGGALAILRAIVPLVLGLLMLTKLFPRFSRLGNLSMGYLVGVGAAVLIGGAVIGTLSGQLRASAAGFDLHRAALAGRSPVGALVEAVIFLFGTISALLYFQFSVRSKNNPQAARPPLLEAIASIGKVFIAVTLGAIFAGVFAAALAALIDRLDFITEFIFMLVF